MLYWRTDLLDRAPRSLAELRQEALRVREAQSARFGLVWQGARYEGLVTVFVEHLAAFGGASSTPRARDRGDPAAIAHCLHGERGQRRSRCPSSALAWRRRAFRIPEW
jgi:hypothetical protein